MHRIGVERSISYLGEGLEKRGYEVVALDPVNASEAELTRCDAVVISGQDQNFMGMEDLKTTVPVISASGRKPSELYQEIENRIQKAKR